MGQCEQQHDAGNLPHAPYSELLQAAIARLGVDAFGRSGPQLVDGFRLLGCHPPACQPATRTLGVLAGRARARFADDFSVSDEKVLQA